METIKDISIEAYPNKFIEIGHNITKKVFGIGIKLSDAVKL